MFYPNYWNYRLEAMFQVKIMLLIYISKFTDNPDQSTNRIARLIVSNH